MYDIEHVKSTNLEAKFLSQLFDKSGLLLCRFVNSIPGMQ
jgi:hypothetical protein